MRIHELDTGPSLTLAPVPFAEAIEWARNRQVTLPETYYGQLQGAARAKAFSIAGVASLSQLQGVLDSLTRSMEQGTPFAEWKKQVRSGAIDLQLPDHRLATIFRTNIQGSYMRGIREQQERNKSRRPYLMYDAINDSRVRPSHLANDGYIARSDDPWWRTHTPPLGYQCRCSVIALTEREALRRGLGKQIEPQTQPDPGWDYDKLANPETGIERAAQQARKESHPALVDALERRSAPGPAGTPVSGALNVDASRRARTDIDRAIGLIDQVHGDGPLPTIPLASNQETRRNGYFGSAGTRATGIGVSVRGSAPLLTTLHEIGHFLDFAGIGTPGRFASTAAPLMDAWRNTAMQSQSVRSLLAVRAQSASKAERGFMDYLTDPIEIWARAYSQYIVARTDDAEAKRQLDVRRNNVHPITRATQWSDEDFRPIGEAIEALFVALGWRR